MVLVLFAAAATAAGLLVCSTRLLQREVVLKPRHAP
jgi:hypothetical protein